MVTAGPYLLQQSRPFDSFIVLNPLVTILYAPGVDAD